MNKYQNRNVGISICRLVMSFFVVCCHFSYFDMAAYAVPFFMFLSFFLATNIFFEDQYKKVMIKIHRLVIPFWGWGIVYYAFKTVILNEDINRDELVWQLLLGHSVYINQALWYLCDEILIILLFAVVFFLIKKKEYRVLALIALMIISLLFQYTELNYRIFDMMDYTRKYPLGRLAEMLPFACSGLLLGQIDWKKVKYRYLFTVCLVLLLLAYGIRHTEIKGFGYSSIQTMIIAICVSLIAIYAPIKMSDGTLWEAQTAL